jgi:hypothetical protein
MASLSRTAAGGGSASMAARPRLSLATAPQADTASLARSRRWRGIRRRVLLAGVSLVASLLLAELAARLFYPVRKTLGLERFEQWVSYSRGWGDTHHIDAELGFVPTPDSRDYDHFGIARRPGSEPQAKGARTRVLFLGDSVTRRGHIIDALRAILAGTPVEFINAGIESFNTVQEVGLYFRLTRGVEADQVVLSLHNNDFAVTPVWIEDGSNLVICNPGNLVTIVPWLYRTSQLYRIWVNVQNRYPHDDAHYLAMLGPAEAALRRLRDALQAEGRQLSVVILPLLEPLAKYRSPERQSREAAMAICQRLGIRTFDVAAALEPLFAAGIPMTEKPDDIWHPNDTAAFAIAKQLVREGLLPAAPPGELRLLDGAGTRAGGESALSLQFAPACAGAEYWVLASWAGCEPCFTFQEHIPLNPDELTSSTILAPEAALGCSRGRLDSDSRATIRLRLPPAPATLRFPVLALAAVAYAVPPLRILQVSQPLRIAVDR